MKYLKELKKLNLPLKEYAIFGSGPLDIRKIRESNDLDIVVKKSLWNKLIKKYTSKTDYLIQIGDIGVYRTWPPWRENIDELIDDCEIIEGFPFIKLKYVLIWKKHINRDKDKKDVKLIENYLQKRKKS